MFPTIFNSILTVRYSDLKFANYKRIKIVFNHTSAVVQWFCWLSTNFAFKNPFLVDLGDLKTLKLFTNIKLIRRKIPGILGKLKIWKPKYQTKSFLKVFRCWQLEHLYALIIKRLCSTWKLIYSLRAQSS